MVALVMALAGCPKVASTTVTPVVEDISETNDGQYRAQITASVSSLGDDEELPDVRVVGYSLDGSEVCAADFGTLDDSASRTITCDSFPSLFVAQTPAAQRTPDQNGFAPDPGVDTDASRYVGSTNGSHKFRSFRTHLRAVDRQSGVKEPTTELFQREQCMQWRARADGGNFSVLGDAPWLTVTDAETVNTTHQVTLSPGTPPQNTTVYNSSEMPPVVADAVEETVGQNRTSTLTNATFDNSLRSLTDRPVDSWTRRGRVLARLPGVTVTETTLDIECQPAPPMYEIAPEIDPSANTRSQSVSVWLRDEDRTVRATFDTEQRIAHLPFVSKSTES